MNATISQWITVHYCTCQTVRLICTFCNAQMAGAIPTTSPMEDSNNRNFVEIARYIADGSWTATKKVVNAKSDIWKTVYIVLNEQNETVDGIVYCPVCKTVLKYVSKSGTTSLKWHISKCKIAAVNSDMQLTEQSNGKYFIYLTCMWPFLCGIFFLAVNIYQSQMSKEHKDLMMNAAVDFVSHDMRPINALNGIGLRSLLSTYGMMWKYYGETGATPPSLLPSVDAVTKNVTSRARNLRKSLQTILKNQFFNVGGGICLDIWKDKFRKIDYLGVTVHYIDDSFRHNVRLIACKPLSVEKSKTGEYVKKKLMHILDFYGVGLSKNVVFVTDRGSNMKKALEDYLRHNCSDHFISNTINEGLASERAKEVLVVCQNIVSTIKRCGKSSLFQPSLKAAIKVRWNSAIDMFVSVSHHWEKLQQYFADAGQITILCDVTKDEIDCLIRFLKPFKAMTLKLEQINRATQHLVHMAYDYLDSHLIPNENDPDILADAKNRAEFYYRETLLNDGMITTVHKAAVFLHPSMKDLSKMTRQDKEDIELYVSTITHYYSCIAF